MPCRRLCTNDRRTGKNDPPQSLAWYPKLTIRQSTPEMTRSSNAKFRFLFIFNVRNSKCPTCTSHFHLIIMRSFADSDAQFKDFPEPVTDFRAILRLKPPIRRAKILSDVNRLNCLAKHADNFGSIADIPLRKRSGSCNREYLPLK